MALKVRKLLTKTLRSAPWLLAGVFLGPAPASAQTAGPYTPWFDARFGRVPAAPEAWQEVEWHTDLREARRAAAETGRPIFLCSMNGNPLGCT